MTNASGTNAGGLHVDGRRRKRIAAARTPGSKKVIYAALAGNAAIAAIKFCAAALTGSSSMLSEGAHSLVDTANELLLLHGIRRSNLPPDKLHPLGHGRELYFWSFAVALLVFALGAGVAFVEGIFHIIHPAEIRNFPLSYGVLAVSFVFEGMSWGIALREFSGRKGSLGYLAAMRRSKDPPIFMVLLEDSAALLGLSVAFCGLAASQWLGRPELDGYASVGIGLILTVVALFLAQETKDLLIGERASPQLEAAILRIAAEEPLVKSANGVLTIHLAPDQVVAALSAEFQSNCTAGSIEDCVTRIEARLTEEYPQLATIFVKPQSTLEWHSRQRRMEANAETA